MRHRSHRSVGWRCSRGGPGQLSPLAPPRGARSCRAAFLGGVARPGEAIRREGCRSLVTGRAGSPAQLFTGPVDSPSSHWTSPPSSRCERVEVFRRRLAACRSSI